MLGNPKTDDFVDVNSVVPFAHRLTLISDELYDVFPFEFYSSNILVWTVSSNYSL